MDNSQMLRALKLEKLKRLQNPPKKINLRDALFSQQIKAIEDKSKRIALFTTRRAGKSTCKGAKALEIADLYPGCDIPYIALTRDSTERIIWKVLKEFVEKYDLPYRCIDSELKVKTPKGSTVFLIGADQRNFIDRLRGSKFPAAFVDEGGHFRDSVLEPLCEDVLDACLADFNGQLYLSGTPGPVPSGYFYEATQKKHGFSVHSWSVIDNPHLPHINPQWLEEKLKQKGQTAENPTFRREWLGEWVEDLDALVYKYKRDRNDYSGEVPEGYRTVMGLDFGYNDKTAFAILHYHPNHPKIWVRHVEGHASMIPSEIAGRAKQLLKTYNVSQIIADTGGLGKSIAEELIRRYGLPVVAASKTDKQSWISLLNGDFIDGNLLVHDSCDALKEQYQKLAKDEYGEEDPTMPNDLCDSVLYAYRHVYAYAHKPEVETKVDKFTIAEKRFLEAESKKASKEWWE